MRSWHTSLWDRLSTPCLVYTAGLGVNSREPVEEDYLEHLSLSLSLSLSLRSDILVASVVPLALGAQPVRDARCNAQHSVKTRVLK